MSSSCASLLGGICATFGGAPRLILAHSASVPCGSQSIARTFSPDWVAATARHDASELLPLPPFCEVRVMILIDAYICSSISAYKRQCVRPSVISRLSHPGHIKMQFSIPTSLRESYSLEDFRASLRSVSLR